MREKKSSEKKILKIMLLIITLNIFQKVCPRITESIYSRSPNFLLRTGKFKIIRFKIYFLKLFLIYLSKSLWKKCGAFLKTKLKKKISNCIFVVVQFILTVFGIKYEFFGVCFGIFLIIASF